MAFVWAGIARACQRRTSRYGVFPNAVQRPILSSFTLPNVNQVRTRYANWQMRKDTLKRQTIKEQYPVRMRINAIRKNTILPKEIREIADQEIAALPLNSSIVRKVNRCVITSRGRGVVRRWRFSRIVWRHLADYNKLAGVIRACW